MAYYFDRKFTHILHEQEEMKVFGDTVKKRLVSDPALIHVWLTNALKYQNMAEEFIGSAKVETSTGALKELIGFFSNYLANATNIPHRLSWVFEKESEVGQELLTALTEVRIKNFAPELNKICLGVMAKLIKDTDERKYVHLISPAEILEEVPWPSREEILRREQGWLLRLCDGDRIFTSGQNAHDVYRKLLETENNSVDAVRGSTAYRGKVTGTVIVVNSIQKLQEVYPGCVLVTNMTTPNYIPYLAHVVAIVTDEGGITCHAAIVSRELKKPCIIGTKIATKVLKDGDMMEVNADEGMVRIIKKSN